MATSITKYKYNVPVTCTSGGTESWLSADFKFVVEPNSSNTAYSVKVYARIEADYEIYWSGDAVLRVKCNGKSSNKSVSLQIYSSSGGTTSWDGPASFSFGAPGDLTLDFDIDLDLTSTTGTNGKAGIYHTSDGGNMTHFKTNGYEIDVTAIPLIQAPVISNLVNNNKLNNQNGVSANTDSISLKWDSTGDAIVSSYYRIGTTGSWTKTSNTTSHVITGLSPGTSYTIYVYSENSVGTSGTLNITVRTKYNNPVVELSLKSKDVESLTLEWKSNYSLSSCEYRIDYGSWINANQTGTSGSFMIKELTPGISYNIQFRGISASQYDSLSSNEAVTAETTANRAKLGQIGDCIFGMSIQIPIPYPDETTGINYSLKLEIQTAGNSNNALMTFDNLGTGTFTFTPTQSQLDQMYKCFSNENTIPIYFTLYTHGESQDWADAIQEKPLQLTGIAKTAHIGIDNKPRRAQAWQGVNNQPRRAIIWVGDQNNKPRRCI